jgi:cellulose synthase operon protein C
MMRAAKLLPAVLALLVAAQPACARQASADEHADAATLLATGRYEQAIAAYRAAVAADGGADDHRGLVRALLEVGRYADALAAAEAGVAAHGAELERWHGVALHAVGRRGDAETAFERALAGQARDAASARVARAELLWQRGAREEAAREFDRLIDLYNTGPALDADDLLAVGTAVRYLGAADHRLFQDALHAFDEASAADPLLHDARVRVGDLFLEKYNSPDAKAEYEAVLRVNASHPAALLGMARAHFFEGSPAARTLAEQALEINASLVAAHVFLARLELGLEDFDAAGTHVERALAIDAASPEANAMAGAIAFLRDDLQAYERLRDDALRRNPVAADFFATIAETAVLQRRYDDAVALAERAVQLDPQAWNAWATLGLNRMRVGDPAAARDALARAFDGDPYNVWVKNTLDLLDTYPEYVTVRTPRFELFLHGREADLLAPYMEWIAEEAYDALAARYDVRPEPPIRIEVFPRSADFSVRTLGLTGLGALGVAFGSQLAMDSPGARDIGDFNWGSTLWHEIAHTFTLAASRNRVPRWLTEGLSVLEERRARAGWGSGPSIGFLAAYASGRLHPPSRLNLGFTRPDYPEMVMYSYYQASLVAEMIEQDHGIAAIRQMLRAYGDGRTNEQVLRDVLRTDPARFDARFDAFMRERFASPLAALRPERIAAAGSGAPRLAAQDVGAARDDDYVALIVAGRRALDGGHFDEAARLLERAAALFPQTGAPDGPWRMLAEAHRRRGDVAAEAASLARLVAVAESDYLANVRLAELRRAAGDARGEADALERAIWISPYDVALHVRLAELYAELGDLAGVVRERRAVVALQPVDRADAYYRLAIAELAAGDRDAARRSVLRALEIAPGFEAAQELLLEVRSR